MSIPCRRHAYFFVLLLISLLQTSCGDSDDTGDSGDAPGAACEIDDRCPNDVRTCYAVGSLSSCQGGGLCAGPASALTCAARCESDADCVPTNPNFVCFLECEEPLFHGYCTDPMDRDELMTYPFCDMPGDPRGGVAGTLG